MMLLQLQGALDAMVSAVRRMSRNWKGARASPSLTMLSEISLLSPLKVFRHIGVASSVENTGTCLWSPIAVRCSKISLIAAPKDQ
jgi:hypothetical protein